MNRGLVIAGAVLLALSLLIPFTAMAGPDDWENIVMFIILTFVVSPFLFLGGLVMLIVGLISGRQHQQQQVVIMANPHAVGAGGMMGGAGSLGGAGGKACRRCRTRMGLADRFCNACGAAA